MPPRFTIKFFGFVGDGRPGDEKDVYHTASVRTAEEINPAIIQAMEGFQKNRRACAGIEVVQLEGNWS